MEGIEGIWEGWERGVEGRKGNVKEGMEGRGRESDTLTNATAALTFSPSFIFV